jgi:hypothetical protein
MKKLLLLLSITSFLTIKAQDTITVMAYNILNYPASNSTKADTLKPIIQHVEPDIFMITELTSSSGVSTILNDALNVDGITHFQNATYNNGPDTDNMLYYNSDKLVLYSQHEIPTALRNISEYVLYYDSPGLTALSDTVFIYCYMAHLKASSGSTNEQKRNQEAISLKNYLSTRTGIENVILGGDFNLYTSSEPAYNTILNSGSVVLQDPISSPGAWNNNASFANIHTQSTRSSSIGDGGAFGGMDDRFDFIFFGPDLVPGSNGLTYVPGSYTALGNDGNHFNKSINDSPTNLSAPTNVIDALYYMSDHLPITIKAYVAANVGVEEEIKKNVWEGFLYDGKFNFSSNKQESRLKFEVFDLLGKLVLTNRFDNQNEVEFQLNGLKGSLYFVKVSSANQQKSFKVLVR